MNIKTVFSITCNIHFFDISGIKYISDILNYLIRCKTTTKFLIWAWFKKKKNLVLTVHNDPAGPFLLP